MFCTALSTQSASLSFHVLVPKCQRCLLRALGLGLRASCGLGLRAYRVQALGFNT